jgi:ribosomal protein L32
MSKPNSYGSKASKARRKAVADANATQTQISCKECGARHRKGRDCRG